MTDKTTGFDAPHNGLIVVKNGYAAVSVLDDIGNDSAGVCTCDNQADLSDFSVFDSVADFVELVGIDGERLDVAVLNSLSSLVAAFCVVQISVDPHVSILVTVQEAVAEDVVDGVVAVHPDQGDLSTVEVRERAGSDDAAVTTPDVTLGSEASEVRGPRRFIHFDPPHWKFWRV